MQMSPIQPKRLTRIAAAPSTVRGKVRLANNIVIFASMVLKSPASMFMSLPISVFRTTNWLHLETR